MVRSESLDTFHRAASGYADPMIDTEIEVDVPDIYAFAAWRKFGDFPNYFRAVTDVTGDPAGVMAWTVEIAGIERSFDVAVTEEIPGKRIAWSSVEGAEHSGVVTFHKLTDESCRVKLQMEFEPNGLLEQLADKAQIARLAVDYELGEFKAVVEAGRKS